MNLTNRPSALMERPMPTSRPAPATNHRSLSASRRGFSITELLVVIFVIALIIAITVPALSSARASAKRTETSQLLSTLASGVAQFRLDENRQPGYFSVQDMGHSENATEGFSGMQNIMLEMLGGIVPDNTPAGANIISVGPRSGNASKVKVDRNQINLAQPGGRKLYWASLGSKVFERADENGLPVDISTVRRLGFTPGNASPTGNQQIREIVDAFGSPVLAWAADDSIRTPVTSVDDFARIDSDSQPIRSRYYWNSNAAFLANGVQVGVQAKLQYEAPPDSGIIRSMISQQRTAVDRQRTLTGLLGNPGSPLNPTDTTITNILPSAPLASVTFHAAGRDAYYLGIANAGAKQAGPSGAPILDYGKVLRDKLVEKFDDVVQAAN
jgi:prepilin-type N-terminal cleavage/methylation domain-containing protein